MNLAPSLQDILIGIGRDLRAARKRQFPADDQRRFAARVQVSRATYQKMEKGDPGVAMGSYLLAADMLGVAANFEKLFESAKKPSLLEGVEL